KILHSLIQLSLGDGNCNDTEKMEEAWHHFSDALSLIHNSTEQLDYPEIEILWLMTKSWNTGIYAYGTGKPQIAMKWSSLSMKFLSQLRDFKQSYEPK
ncbi:putative testis-expressed sequence 11 protein isoform X2, partial [Apostichopus japonicus]